MENYDLSYKLTIKSISIYMGKTIDILDFAHRHYGCVIRPGGRFRCTYYDKDITMNMYSSGSFIVFTYSISMEELRAKIYKLFGTHNVHSKLSNQSIRFKFPHPIILDEVRKRLISLSLDDIFMCKERPASSKFIEFEDGMRKCCVLGYTLNTQSFAALRVHLWKEKRIKVMIFSTGSINCTGLKKDSEIEDVKEYLRDALFPVLEQCVVSQDDIFNSSDLEALM